jgi:LruC domain-containing protein
MKHIKTGLRLSKNMKKLYLIFALSVFVLDSCIEQPDIDQESQKVPENIPSEFSFRTTYQGQLDFRFSDINGSPITKMMISVWDNEPWENGKVIFRSLTDDEGRVFTEHPFSNTLESVILEVKMPGIPNYFRVEKNNGVYALEYSGIISPQHHIIQDKSDASGGKMSLAKKSGNALTINYFGTYNNVGVPDYLEPQRDQISSTLLQYINASLPESMPVPQYHPSFLANGKKTSLDIDSTADVWLTFVHEGAGWTNAIAYYTYPTGTPPQSINDINEITVVFPNLSFAGSGGGLQSGDKVFIGRFNPGVSIGLVLMADAWDGNTSEDYYHLVFADKNLNPEPDENLKQHNVLLWDEENELFLVGFEDVRRDDIPFACDQDFNDAILFVSSNPVKAISTRNVSPIDKPGTSDRDGDGVNDILDEYPDDINKAYDSYYPGSTSYGTFAFEDNWPDYGDYDFNDAVIDYQFRHSMNASNKVVEIESKFLVRALGAGYRNGFGFATDLLPGDIASVNGSMLNAGYIQLNGNGTESNQNNAVFIAIDNLHDLFPGAGFVNTEEQSTHLPAREVSLLITLNNPKDMQETGNVPYNPFLIISGNRGREVHLPGYSPTNLVDQTLFGTLDDDSDPLAGIYYRSKTDLPWGIHLPESFDYPREKSDIRTGHLRFTDWARSFGFSYLDWYRDQSGYRNGSFIYTIP